MFPPLALGDESDADPALLLEKITEDTIGPTRVSKGQEDVATMKTPSSSKPDFWGDALVDTPEKDPCVHVNFVSFAHYRF